MSNVVIAIIGIVVLVILLLLRMPIAFSMLIVGVAGFGYLKSINAGLSLLGPDLFDQLSNYSFTAIPMFILAGAIAFEAGIGERLFGAAYTVLRRVPGGLAVAAIAACAGFAAICGSTAATAATMGKIAIPEMRKYGYDDALSTGTVAAAGTLGVLIPPSTIFIIYGILTEQSIGKLFLAGIMPGILLTVLLIATVIIRCVVNPSLAPRTQGMIKKTSAFRGIIGISEVVVLFLIVIGGLSLGFFTPTQAGGVLVAAVTILALARKQIKWNGFEKAFRESARISCMILFIVSASVIFGRFIAISRVPIELSSWFSSLAVSPIILVILIMVLYIIGGCFMDGMALLMLTLPVYLATLQTLHVDLIWFGVLIVLQGEIGGITPPVGLNVFVIKGITKDIPISTIFRGIFPFIGTLLICIILILVFPQIATWLPNLISH
jgi:C4-dicarboxylate transporter, DctM subunit